MTSGIGPAAPGPAHVEAETDPTSGSGSPVWFGPPGRPLFGMVHVPPGNTARGGVVLCSPLGREDLAVHSALRVLAERLAAAGLVVLRFDYDGTGNSSGSSWDGDRVTAWTTSINVAVDLLRSAGAPALTVVGMRMGALLALYAAGDRPVDALVLWDPCRSGRVFIRELQALHSMSVEDAPVTDGSVQTPGFRFDAETVAALGALDLAKFTGPLAPRLLLLARPDRPVDPTTRARLSQATVLDVEPAFGQNQILAVDGRVNDEVQETIGRVTAWIAAKAPPDPVALRPGVLDPAPESRVVSCDNATPVVERAVRFGRAELFGIVTEADPGAGSPTASAGAPVPTVVCFNTGKSRLIGPSRMWVDLARLWAAHGIRTLRMDLSGLGDSGARPGQTRDVFYPTWATQDVEEAARFVSPDDPSQVVFVGLCSGAFHAVLGGLLVGARGVCALNPVFNRRSIPAPDAVATSDREPPRQASGGRGPRLRARSTASAVRRVAAPVARALPEPMWSLSTRLGLRRSPVHYLDRLVRAGTDVLLVTGEEEATLIRRGAAGPLRRLEGSGRLEFHVITDLDHALFGAQDRPRVHDIVSTHVVKAFGPGAGR